MAQSAVDVCNSALQRVGANSIISLADNSREARAVSLSFDSNRRDEIRKHNWNFAIKRVILAPDATAPAFEFTYQFTLPADCLRVMRPPTTNLDWEIEGRKILTNDSSVLNLKYIADITDVAQWDSSFYNVFASALALDIVEVLTQSNQKKAMLKEDYKDAIAEAKKMDSFEAGPEDPPDDEWWLARL